MKLKTTLLIALLIFAGIGAARAQVGVGTNSPDGSAALDVEATDKGFLPPRMTEAERNNISNPTQGLTIYNTDDKCLNIYVGYWRNLCADPNDNTENTGTITHNGNDYEDIYNPATGETWLDRNLGAYQVATGTNDNSAYGYLYQWGRAADGHELRTSAYYDAITNGYPPNATASGAWDGKFISTGKSTTDWLGSNSNNNLWQGVNGTNNPCPTDYRVPTEAEWEAERQSWSSNDRDGAYTSPLKLPSAENKNFGLGEGNYWSSTVSGSDTRFLFFDGSTASILTRPRGHGYSVRCIKE